MLSLQWSEETHDTEKHLETCLDADRASSIEYTQYSPGELIGISVWHDVQELTQFPDAQAEPLE